MLELELWLALVRTLSPQSKHREKNKQTNKQVTELSLQNSSFQEQEVLLREAMGCCAVLAIAGQQ